MDSQVAGIRQPWIVDGGLETAAQEALYRIGSPRLALRETSLPQRNHEATRDDTDHHRRCRQHDAVPAQELPDAIGALRAPGRDRQACEFTAHILRQSFHRGIPLVGGDAQSGDDDRIEITSQTSQQASRFQAPEPGHC